MKQCLYIICFSLIFIQFSCKKAINSEIVSDNYLIEEAKQYFENNFNNSGNKANNEYPRKGFINPIWTNAKVIKLKSGKEAVIIPIEYRNSFLIKSTISGDSLFNINDLTRLLIYKDKQQKYQAERVTFLPDKNYLAGDKANYTGIILVEDYYGTTLHKLKYDKGGIIKKSLEPQTKSNPDLISGSIPTEKGAITFCYYIEGYNYSPSDPSNTYYWSELIGCQTTFFASEKEYNYSEVQPVDYSGMSGGAIAGPANVVSVESGDKIIANLKAYFKCFINVPGNDHNYEITVCVAQPEPGTRKTWGVNSGSGSSASGNPVYVGHTFFILKETTPTRTIIRNLGFYPSTGVNPYSPSAQGSYNNDEDRDYDISLTISVTNSQFFTVLNYINQGDNNTYTYNLNSFNCTSFVINALNTIGINLPQTKGQWPNGGGLNPGDLGEDIRGMTLASNMTRTTAYGTHPNKSTCY